MQKPSFSYVTTKDLAVTSETKETSKSVSSAIGVIAQKIVVPVESVRPAADAEDEPKRKRNPFTVKEDVIESGDDVVILKTL